MIIEDVKIGVRYTCKTRQVTGAAMAISKDANVDIVQLKLDSVHFVTESGAEQSAHDERWYAVDTLTIAKE